MATLFDSIKKVYKITVKCRNCQSFAELSIPKGVTIESYLKSERAICSVCGVAALEKYNYPLPEEKKVVPARIVFDSPSTWPTKKGQKK